MKPYQDVWPRPVYRVDYPNGRRVTGPTGLRWYVGHVYVARFGDRIKIGFSSDVPQRLRQLAYEAGEPGQLMRTIEVMHPSHRLRMERACHDQFRHLRIKGEWYMAAPELIDWAVPPVTPESIRAAKIACNAERARIAALTGLELPIHPIDDEPETTFNRQ